MTTLLKNKNASMGRKVQTFKKTLTYTIIATIIAPFLLFISMAMLADGVNGLGWSIRIITLVGYPLYIFNQLRSEFTVYEKGFRLTTLFGTNLVLWADIDKVNTVHSIVVTDGTFMKAVFRTRTGKKITLQNNWKPREEFYRLISNFLA
ncbi:MAG: hypothetical protein KGO49_01510 [Gammaproteobacteria bacterium]|nr:hypothetical protein [Gammaproteobacteria bacterium]